MAAKTLEERVQRLEDIQEIHNLMGRYVWRHNVGLDSTFPDTLYAQKVKGVSSEVADWGRYEDDDFRKRYKSSGLTGFPPGNMIMHHLDTPVVEIAGDGKTADATSGCAIGQQQPTAPVRFVELLGLTILVLRLARPRSRR